jgi:hypothetical protein
LELLTLNIKPLTSAESFDPFFVQLLGFVFEFLQATYGVRGMFVDVDHFDEPMFGL